jgi:formylglycine-generating enzyme required for sulfatase activity
MVLLPAGAFRLGERTGPLADTVTYAWVGPFLLDEVEVTVAAYAGCVKAGRCSPAAATAALEGLTEADRAAWSESCNRDRADRADHPVNCVDWGQATAYCAWAGKRLPREDEWEWAARNGAGATPYPWGREDPGGRPCWSGGGSDAGGRRAGTCPAGGHPGADSSSGVKDLAGGVWEWTASRALVATDSRGRGGHSARVVRGGGWNDTDPARLSATFRLLDLPGWRSPDLGFRCARDP